MKVEITREAVIERRRDDVSAQVMAGAMRRANVKDLAKLKHIQERR